MLMLMECLGSVVNVGGQTARFPLPTVDADAQSLLVDQPFATSEMGDSMDADLLPELSGETWVASPLLDELTGDLPPAGVNNELVIRGQNTTGGGDTHLGYGILGGKKSGIWDMRAKKSGIWDMGKSSGIWDIGVEIIIF